MRTPILVHVIRITLTLAALVVFGIGARAGGLAGFCLLGLPAIIVLAILWTGSISNRLAGLIVKSTVQSWEQRKKTDLAEIEQWMREKNYAAAARRLDEIIAAEPHHVQAMLRAVTVYRLDGQIDKARQLCLRLIDRDDTAPRTIQALMAQLDMTGEEIQQACAVRQTKDKREP